MEPIFAPSGTLVGWLENDVVFDTASRHIAHIQGGAVYTYTSRQLGYFDNGYFRDKVGDAVAFMGGCTGGPLPPIPPIPPIPAIPAIPPIAPIAPIASVPRVPSLSWSRLGWMEFING